jgi:restriction system protein
MTVPSMKDFFLPCLRLLSGTARNAKDCLPALQKEFGLTAAEMDEVIPSGVRTRVFDRADWAIFHLMKAGLVDRPKRGVYLTSDEGRKTLAAPGITLTLVGLKAKWADRAPSDFLPEFPDTLPSHTVTTDAPPEEMIAAAHAELDAALAEDILSQLQAINPIRFERLILDLLTKMGYGAGNLANSQMTKASGDGGIDGIINEDALGLDAVYIQAKRYAPDSKVGRPALQAFVGSLTGEGATKGVFVTTSDFSKEAREYLLKVQHRIVLVNGERLARLMIQHEVGVRARKTYVLRSVDEDYFSDV